MSPVHKKEVVAAAVKDGVCSGRAGCRILRLSRSGYWYQAGKRSSRQQELVKRIHALADEEPRYGYRRIAALLRDEGWNVGTWWISNRTNQSFLLFNIITIVRCYECNYLR